MRRPTMRTGCRPRRRPGISEHCGAIAAIYHPTRFISSLSSGEKTSDRADLFPQQPHQAQKLVPAGIRDGAIREVPRFPEGEVIAAAGQVGRQCAFLAGPAEDVDDMCTMLVDHYGRTLVIQIIHASADE